MGKQFIDIFWEELQLFKLTEPDAAEFCLNFYMGAKTKKKKLICTRYLYIHDNECYFTSVLGESVKKV